MGPFSTKGQPLIVIDSETYLIGPGRVCPKAVSFQFCDERKTPWMLSASDPTAEAEIANALSNDLIVGQNIAFDMGVIAHNYPKLQPLIWSAYNEGRVLCTMVLEKLIAVAHGWVNSDPRTGGQLRFSLAHLAHAYLGIEVEGKTEADAWRYRFRELDGVPLDRWPEAAKKYALDDALLTFEVYQAQCAFQIEQKTIVPDAIARTRGHWALHLMGAWGLRTNKERVLTLKNELAARVGNARSHLIRAGVIRDDGRKDLKVIRARIEAAYRGRDIPKTAKGSTSTSKDVLEASGDAVLGLLASISNDEKILSTYVPVLEAGIDTPVCPTFNPVVATGRTSCTRPNVQNQPRLGGVRECWIPRKGWVYVQADYSIAELCALAQINLWQEGSSKMAEALCAGKDLHLDFGAQVLGISYEEAERRRKDPDVKEARQMAKAFNFGKPGGLGKETFMAFARGYGLNLSEDRVKELTDAWLRAYPEMISYFRVVRHKVKAGPYTLRQWRSSRIRGAVGYTDGCNSPFQGLCADFGLDACYHVARACYTEVDSPLFGARPVAFVHDEIILEAPVSRAHDCAMELKRIMERRARAWLPDIPVVAEPAIMTAWYKDAEGRFDDNGRLIAWK